MRPFLILHSAINQGAEESINTLDQARFVERLLLEAGVEAIEIVEAPGSLEELATYLKKRDPRFIFNLIETWENTDSLVWLPLMVIESLKIPHSGASANALLLAANKQHLNQLLVAYQIPVPSQYCEGVQGKFIVKSPLEHSSFNLTHHNVVDGSDVKTFIQQLKNKTGKEWFAERFIEGREVNLAILDIEGKPHFLPPIERLFLDEEKRAHVYSYDLKWIDDKTDTRVSFEENDKPFLQEIEALGRRCYDSLNLSGYLRLDFRVSQEGRPYLIDVNLNPSLGFHTDFIAACKLSNMEPREVMRVLSGISSK